MTQSRRSSGNWIKRCGRVLALLAMFRLYGCTIGPQIRQDVVWVRTVDASGNPVSVGRVAENKVVKVMVLDKDGKPVPTKLDIGGWNVSAPAPAQDPAPAKPETKTEEKK